MAMSDARARDRPRRERSPVGKRPARVLAGYRRTAGRKAPRLERDGPAELVQR